LLLRASIICSSISGSDEEVGALGASVEGGGDSEKGPSEGARRLIELELAVLLDITAIDGDETLEFVEDEIDDSESVVLLLWSEGQRWP
jgi:hypothetical protein